MVLIPPDLLDVDDDKFAAIERTVKSIYRLIIFNEEHRSGDLLARYLEAVEHLRDVLSVKNAQQEAQSVDEARIYLRHLKAGLQMIVGEIAADRHPAGPVDIFRLFRKIAPDAARRHPNHYRQTMVQFGPCLGAEPREIPGLVDQLFGLMEQIPNPVVRAIYLHHELVRIHPFVDGNGRLSRMAKNWLLMYELYPPMIISGIDDRKRYIAGMQESFLAVARDPFVFHPSTRAFFEDEMMRIRASAAFVLNRMLRDNKLAFAPEDPDLPAE